MPKNILPVALNSHNCCGTVLCQK